MLLYITRKYPPSIGGMQRFNQKLVAHLRRRQDLILLSWGHSQALMPVFLLYVLLKTITLRAQRKINLIYLADGLMSPLGVFFKKCLSLPVVAAIHGRDIAFNFPGYLKIVAGALKHLDRVICVSGHLMEECRHRGVPQSLLASIPNGVDLDDFVWTEDRSPQEFLGLDLNGKTVLITVGRLVPKKGIDRFVRDILPALAGRHPDLVYLIVGDGPLRREIEALVNAKGLEDNVLLMGNIPMEDKRLIALYNCADIFVMPNVRIAGDIEGFGLAALEGGAAGLPVVASRLQGIQEAIVDGRNGILLPWDDPNAYIDTLLDLIDHPDKRKKLGEDARRFIREHYNWEKIASSYQQAFETLLNNS